MQNRKQNETHQTPEPTFKDQRGNYNEFKHFLFNQIGTIHNKLTNQKRASFVSQPVRSYAIELRQIMIVDRKVTLKNILAQEKKL